MLFLRALFELDQCAGGGPRIEEQNRLSAGADDRLAGAENPLTGVLQTISDNLEVIDNVTDMVDPARGFAVEEIMGISTRRAALACPNG